MAIADRKSRRWFPPRPCGPSLLETILVGQRPPTRVTCTICGAVTNVTFTENLRESGHCGDCGGWNRLRQLALVLLDVAAARTGDRHGSLRELGNSTALRSGPGWAIYNTEAHGSVHEALSGVRGYVCSEYFGPEVESGEVNAMGVRNEDLQQLSFPTASLDLVLSTDVFEHVPKPYQGHEEVARVLRPGGHHVFTVPFDDSSALDQVRARLADDQRIEYLQEPIYHEDPVRPQDGTLVYTIFGLEMIVNLARLGFRTTVYRLHDRRRGIVGPDAIVFDATKQDSSTGNELLDA